MTGRPKVWTDEKLGDAIKKPNYPKHLTSK